MAFTKVVGPGIHTLAQLRTHNIHSAGIITATKFVGEMESGGGSSTFENVTVQGNLTVQGDTTTLNTTLRNVELLRVAADSATTAGIITQTGAGDILNLYDATSEVLTVTDGGKVGIGTTNPTSLLEIFGGDIKIGSAGENTGYGVTISSAYAQIKLPDGQTGAPKVGNLSFGDAADFRIVHDSHHNYMTSFNGDIYIGFSGATPLQLKNSTGSAELYYGSGKKIETTNTGINVTGVAVDDGATHDGDVTFTGANYNALWDKSKNALILNDDAQLNFGTDEDGDIYHDGNQMIVNNATGNLKLRSNSIHIAGTGNEKHIVSTTGVGVTIYYNNGWRLKTTSSGTSFNNQVEINQGTSASGLIVNHTQVNQKAYIRETSDGNSNTGLVIQKKHSSMHPANHWYGDIQFQGWDGSGYHRAGLIECVAVGTPSNDNMPGELRFSTNAGAASQTKILTITKDGNLYHTGGGNNRRYSFASDGTSHYMSFDSTLNGIKLNGYGGIAFETNGTNERLRIGSGGGVGLSTTLIRNQYFMNIAAPSQAYDGASTNLMDGGGICFQGTDNSFATGRTYPGIFWSGNTASLGRARAGIMGRSASNNDGTDIVFLTRYAANGTAMTPADERLRIKSDGGVRLVKTGGNGNFTISRNESVTSDDATVGVIDFANNTAHTVNSRIMGKTAGTSNVGGDLVVETRIDGGSLTEKFRIRGSGSVWIGSATQYGNSGFNISNGGIIATSSGQNTLKLIDSTAQAANVGARILLGGNYRSSGDASPMVELKSFKENGTDNNYAYGFKLSTTPNGGSLSEAIHVTSGGHVNIGGNYTQTASKVQIAGDLLLQEAAAAYQNPELEIYNSNNSAHGGSIKFSGHHNGTGGKYQEAVIKGYGGNGADTGSLVFVTGTNTDKLRLHADGTVEFLNQTVAGIKVDEGNSTNGTAFNIRLDGTEEFRFDPGSITYKNSNNTTRGQLLAPNNYYNNTNLYIDLTQWRLSDSWHILEVFGTVNPNSSGSGAYVDPCHFYIYRGQGWDSGIYHWLYCASVAPPSRHAFPSGTGYAGNAGISAVWYDGSSIVGNKSATSTHYVRLLIPNANNGANFQKNFRVMRRY